jgi:hypothetical protein
MLGAASSRVFELEMPANLLPAFLLLQMMLQLRLLLDEKLQRRESSLLLKLLLRRVTRPRFFHRISLAKSLSTFLISLSSSGWAAGFSSTALLPQLSFLLLQPPSLLLLLLALLLLLPLM